MQGSRLFLGFLLLHITVWTLAPTLFQPNASLDIIECASWGREWQWGYEKHPPLASWLAEVVILLFGSGKLWPFFLLSQFCIAVGFFSVWRLARRLLECNQAVFAVLLLEGMYYYNYTSPEWNPNVLLLALWPLCIWLFHRAISYNIWRDWMFLGCACGLAVLAKYYSAFLLASMLIYLMVNKENRVHFFGIKLWSAAVIFMAVLAPHLYWGGIHGFSTLSYGMNRSNGGGGWQAHIWQPLRFALVQSMVLAPVILMAILLSGKIKPNLTNWFNNKEPRFILTFTLLPFLLTLLVSVVFGLRLKSMWGTPLWPLAGIALLRLWQPQRLNVKYFIALWLFLFLLAPLVYVTQLLVGPHVRSHVSRAHFPGKEIALFTAQEWRERYDKALPAVGGSLWLAGNIAFYAPERPPVYVDLEHGKSLWMDDREFRESGGVIVWDGGYFPTPPFEALMQRFPSVEIQTNQVFSWQTSANIPSFTLGWAIVPPEARNQKSEAR